MSGLRWSQEQLDAYKGRLVQPFEPKPMAAYQALGRLPAGKMNKTERRWADQLDALKYSGVVHDWKFEAIRLVLGPRTTLTPDFFVQPVNGPMRFDEVKGRYKTDDGWAKLKIAAGMFPQFSFRLVVAQRGGGWDVTEIG